MKRLLWAIIGLILAFQSDVVLGDEATLPKASKELLKKLEDFKFKQNALCEWRISTAGKSATKLLKGHLERETEAGNLDGALALKNLEELSEVADPATLGADFPADSKAIVTKFVNYTAAQKAEIARSIAQKEVGVIKLLEQHVSQQTKTGELQTALAIRQEIEKLGDVDEIAARARAATPENSPATSGARPVPFKSSTGAKGTFEKIVAGAAVVELEGLKLSPLVKEQPGVPLKWTEIPSKFTESGAVMAWSENKYNGVANYKVIQSGYALVACDYSYQGNSGGDWTETRWLEKDFKKNGWNTLSESQVGGELIDGDENAQVLFYKKLEVGEAGELRCNKYRPPLFIFFRQE